MQHRPHSALWSPLTTALLTALALMFTLPNGRAEPPRPAAEAVGKQAQRDAEQIAAGLMTVRDPDADLACPKAVANARYSVETMLEVGEKNVKGGYMSVAEFDTAAVPLRAMLPLLTLEDCEAASGNKRAFYQCMSSDYNHALACGKAHPF